MMLSFNIFVIKYFRLQKNGQRKRFIFMFMEDMIIQAFRINSFLEKLMKLLGRVVLGMRVVQDLLPCLEKNYTLMLLRLHRKCIP